MCKLLFSCLFMDFEASQSLHIMSSFSLLCSLFFEDSVTFVLCRLQKHHGQGGAHLKVKILLGEAWQFVWWVGNVYMYGARHHNWPLFVIAAILLSDVVRRQLRYRCKAGNESYPTPKTACACDVRLLNYAWNNADWLTGDLWSWLSANHQRLQYNGPNGHSDVA